MKWNFDDFSLFSSSKTNQVRRKVSARFTTNTSWTVSWSRSASWTFSPNVSHPFTSITIPTTLSCHLELTRACGKSRWFGNLRNLAQLLQTIILGFTSRRVPKCVTRRTWNRRTCCAPKSSRGICLTKSWATKSTLCSTNESTWKAKTRKKSPKMISEMFWCLRIELRWSLETLKGWVEDLRWCKFDVWRFYWFTARVTSAQTPGKFQWSHGIRFYHRSQPFAENATLPLLNFNELSTPFAIDFFFQQTCFTLENFWIKKTILCIRKKRLKIFLLN